MSLINDLLSLVEVLLILNFLSFKIDVKLNQNSPNAKKVF